MFCQDQECETAVHVVWMGVKVLYCGDSKTQQQIYSISHLTSLFFSDSVLGSLVFLCIPAKCGNCRWAPLLIGSPFCHICPLLSAEKMMYLESGDWIGQFSLSIWIGKNVSMKSLLMTWLYFYLKPNRILAIKLVDGLQWQSLSWYTAHGWALRI